MADETNIDLNTTQLPPEIQQQIDMAMAQAQQQPSQPAGAQGVTSLPPQIQQQISQAPQSLAQQAQAAQATQAQIGPSPTPDMSAGGNSQLPAQLSSLVQQPTPPPPGVQGGLTSQQAAEQAGMPPKPTVGGLPGLIMDLLHPTRGVAPGQPVPTKLDRFEGFLGNFLQSLSAGFTQEGHGPGAAMRGAGAAMQAPYQSAVQQYQLEEKAKQEQAQIALEQQRVKTMTPSIPVTDPRTGAVLNIAPADMGRYLAAGYRLQGIEDTNKTREKVAETKVPPQVQALREAAEAYSRGDMNTYNAKLKEATQMSAAAKPATGMPSAFGKLTPEMAAVGMPPDYRDTEKYPLGMKDPKFLSDVQTYGQKVTGLKQRDAIQLASARGMSYAYGRAMYMQVPVLNQSTQTPEFATPLQIAANSGTYVPLGEGDKVMMKNAIFEDIGGASKNLRKAIVANKDQFSASQIAEMTAAMDIEPDPKSGLFHKAIDNMISATGKNALSKTQQQVVVAMAQNIENAYALRGVAGFGQGSDDLRRAIRTTLPSLSSPPPFALKQLDAYDAQASRLRRGIPRVNIRPEGGGDNTKGGFNWNDHPVVK